MYVCTVEKMKDIIKKKIEKTLVTNTFNFFKILGNTDLRNSTYHTIGVQILLRRSLD